MRTLPIFLLFVGLLFTSCCDDLDYTLLYQVKLQLHQHDSISQNPLVDSSVMNTDTLYIRMQNDYTYVAASTNWLINSATAHSCEYGMKGLKDRIGGILFQSDQPYNG